MDARPVESAAEMPRRRQQVHVAATQPQLLIDPQTGRAQPVDQEPITCMGADVQYGCRLSVGERDYLRLLGEDLEDPSPNSPPLSIFADVVVARGVAQDALLRQLGGDSLLDDSLLSTEPEEATGCGQVAADRAGFG
jgi:hypothetical protein